MGKRQQIQETSRKMAIGFAFCWRADDVCRQQEVAAAKIGDRIVARLDSRVVLNSIIREGSRLRYKECFQREKLLTGISQPSCARSLPARETYRLTGSVPLQVESRC